jgi:hypothetical protein
MMLRIAMEMTGGEVRRTLKEWKHDLLVRGIVGKHTHTHRLLPLVPVMQLQK